MAVGTVKYYGIKDRIREEDKQYAFQKRVMWLSSCIPGKSQKIRRIHYESAYEPNYDFLDRFDNSIPEGKELFLQEFVTVDLVKREDKKQLRDGLKTLLYSNRTRKFLNIKNEGIDAIIEKIEKMDASLMTYTNVLDCGLFDFENNNHLREIISYFSLKIINVNTSYLGIECAVTLSNESNDLLRKIMYEDYHHKRGYPQQFLSTVGCSVGKRVTSSYTTVHYNDAYLKADRIYEFITCIEWKFYNALRKYIPVLIHGMNMAPPRIDIFGTDIDYKDTKTDRFFWESIGISNGNGQFIDKDNKIFFSTTLSGRYKSGAIYGSRIIFLYRSDVEPAFDYIHDIEHQVHLMVQDYLSHLFRFMILYMLSETVSRIIVHYKTQLDKISYGRNKLRGILKLEYGFEREIESYRRYVKDEPWKVDEFFLGDLFYQNDNLLDLLDKPIFIKSHAAFQEGAIISSERINNDIKMLVEDFERKRKIHQSLFDYKNVRITWIIGVITLIVAGMTLWATIDRDGLGKVIETIRKIIEYLISIFRLMD